MTQDRAVEWMAEHGITGYATAIRDLLDYADEVRAEAGRYWQYCTFTQAQLRKIEEEIAEIKQAALDRYEDWASD